MKGFQSILSKALRPQLKANKLWGQMHHGAHSPSYQGQEGLCTADDRCTFSMKPHLHLHRLSLTAPVFYARLSLQTDRCQADKLATGRTAALHCLSSSIFWCHWYFSFLPDSFSLAFHTKSQFSFPNSSGKVLVDSYWSQKSLTTAHDPNDEAIQPGWGPCFMTHSSQMSRWQSLIHMILKFT